MNRVPSSPSSPLEPLEAADLERPAATAPTEAQLDELPNSDAPRHDAYAAWRFPGYRLWSIGGFVSGLGSQLQSVTIGYDLARRAPDAREASLILGIVALVQGLPVLLLALPAGHIADHWPRQKVVMAGLLSAALGSVLLWALSARHAPLPMIYGCLFLLSLANALYRPAMSAFVPQLVPPAALSNAITWSSTRWQVAGVLGPALFGPMLWLLGGAPRVYLISALCLLAFFALAVFVRPLREQEAPPPDETSPLQSLMAGARFVWRTDLVLATLTLDLFAVLLGGAVTLLPVFAEHILKVDAAGLGYLRAAPAVGSLMTALLLAYLPPMPRAGKALLWAVGGFGAATVVFGISRNFWLSLFALFLTGAFDMISVVVRHTLVQLVTPDHMRGRVAAVNSVFIGASNELGGFESGVVAKLFSPMFSVVLGGIGTLMVVLATGAKWPQIARLRRLDELKVEE